MNYELPDGSAALAGEEELHGKEYNIVDPDLNNSLGNVAMDEDKYTQKCDIIKVSLTEVILKEEGSFRAGGPNVTKGAVFDSGAKALARPGARHGTAADLRTRR